MGIEASKPSGYPDGESMRWNVVLFRSIFCHCFCRNRFRLSSDYKSFRCIEIDKGTTVNSATFKLVPISRETFWGDAGSCTLDYLSEGYIQWTITVPGAVIVSFEGNLHFNKLGTPFGTFDHAISAYGTIGTEDVKYGLSKGKWEVEFTGIATAANGDMYSVVDGATLAFSVTK